MFDRQAVGDIKAWYNSRHRQPLVVRGARQVGKSTAVELAAQALGVPLYAVNLEQHPTLERQFASFDVDRVLFSLSAILGEPITPESKGILFLDEAQATPSAYACLRYFYENAPRLAVVLTGSLLGQVLDNYPFSAPVGRVQHYFMGPVGFSEFLRALGDARLLNALDMTTAQTLDFIPDEIHEKLMERARQYILVGGMPAAVQLAIDTDFDHRAISQRQSDIISACKADFSKYRGRLDGLRLQGFFEGVLAQVGKQFSHKLAHRIVNETDGDNRLLNSALAQFREAQLFHRVSHSNADGVPLGADPRTRICKYLFVDVGLLLAAQGLPAQSVMSRPLELAGDGALAEQFAGQLLLHSGPGYKPPELHYWHPPRTEAQAEVDFLLQQEGRVYPVEVKAGASGKLRSLHSYVLKKNASLAVRIHSGRPGLETLRAKRGERQRDFRLLNLPFYMIDLLPRLLKELEEQTEQGDKTGALA